MPIPQWYENAAHLSSFSDYSHRTLARLLEAAARLLQEKDKEIDGLLNEQSRLQLTVDDLDTTIDGQGEALEDAESLIFDLQEALPDPKREDALVEWVVELSEGTLSIDDVKTELRSQGLG